MDENSIRSNMQASLEALSSDIAGIRTGRATPSLVENINILVYGGAQKLRVMELASISATDTQTLVISPWDKSIIGEIKQGLLAANIGLNPSIDGEVIRLTLPPLTTEDREKYVKLLHAKLEIGRVNIRKIRGDSMHDLKKSFEAKSITEDEKFAFEKKIQDLTDEYIAKIEEKGAIKEKELLTL